LVIVQPLSILRSSVAAVQPVTTGYVTVKGTTNCPDAQQVEVQTWLGGSNTGATFYVTLYR